MFYVNARNEKKLEGRDTCCQSGGQDSLTPQNRVLLENLTGLQIVKKYPELCGTRMSHYCIHNSLPPFTILSQTNPVHAPLHPIT
jgi:hypothetical protein